MAGSQIYPSTDNKELYEESRRLVEELDARIADISRGNLTTYEDEQRQQKQHGKVYLSVEKIIISYIIVIVFHESIYCSKIKDVYIDFKSNN
jgi:hypothetical protein